MQTIKNSGQCHVFGDDIPLDEGVMAFKYAIERITDPQVLLPHLFECVDKDFISRVKTGDFVVAGKNFGCGKPHFQGLIAMKALNMAILCESMPYKVVRGAIALGLPILTGWTQELIAIDDGDAVEVNFETGTILNITKKITVNTSPMPEILQEIIRLGGVKGQLQGWLKNHPELLQDAHLPSIIEQGVAMQWHKTKAQN